MLLQASLTWWEWSQVCCDVLVKITFCKIRFEKAGLVRNTVIHSLCYLSYEGPMSLLKRVLHSMRFGASSFNFLYFVFSLRSSSSCLRLSPRLPVHISFLLSFVPQSVLEGSSFAWCNQSVFLRFILCRIFHSSLTVCNTSSILTR